jgi:hypothetical protein
MHPPGPKARTPDYVMAALNQQVVDDGIFSTGHVRIIADDPGPVVLAPKSPKKDPWWKRLWKAIFG